MDFLTRWKEFLLLTLPHFRDYRKRKENYLNKRKKKEQGKLVLSAELITEICYRKEFQSWRFER